MRHEEIVPPPLHRIERGHIVKTETDRGGLELRVAHQLPLDRYLSRKLLTPKQHRAGRRYEYLWAMSQHIHHHRQVAYNEYTNGSYDPEARFLIAPEFVEAGNAIRGVLPRHYVKLVCLDGIKAGPANIPYLLCGLDDLVDYFKEGDARARRQIGRPD